MRASVLPAARSFVLACLLAAAIPAVHALRLGEEAESARRFTATGTITAVDSTARTITLKGRRGVFTFRLDPKVHLDQLKPGERVKVDYVAAFAMTLRRGGDAMRKQVESEAAARAQPAGATGAAHPVPITIVTRVLAVNKGAQTVRLKGPEGQEVDFQVRDKADLDGVRVGDQIVAVVYEAVAVGVVPAAK